jgi:hypothetical protein
VALNRHDDLTRLTACESIQIKLRTMQALQQAIASAGKSHLSSFAQK